MAVARVKTWQGGEELTETDLNAEFDNILNNGSLVPFPVDRDLSAAGFDLTEIDELAFATTAATGASAFGRLRRNGSNITWHDGTGAQSLMLLGSNFIGGLEMTNSATDAANDIILAAGVATDATNSTLIRLTAALDKQADAAWAVGAATGGLDTGTINNTTTITYHLHLIKRPDTGVVDALYSTSPSAPVMPANYTLRRRVGSLIRTSAAAAFLPFTQMLDRFYLNTVVTDYGSTQIPTAGSITTVLTVPTGINVLAEGLMSVFASAVNVAVLISDISETDQTASLAENIGSVIVNVSASQVGAHFRCRTNTSAAVRLARTAAGSGVTFTIGTRGWVDVRGRNGGL